MKKLTSDFKKLVDSDKLSHAYLFFGEAVEEKFVFALSLANYLENKKFEPLEKNILEECLIGALDKECPPDERACPPTGGKESIGIDFAKKINNFLYQKPVLSKKRTAIIKDADSLTPEAQNALLKTVEDSPQGALLIFIAKDENSLLPPLMSRLQRIYFSIMRTSVDWTRTYAEKWKSFSKAGLEEIIENDKIDEYFEALIANLRKDPIKNVDKLREAIKRLVAIKRFNTNKKLQMRCLS